MNNTDLCGLAKLYADSKFITVTHFMQIFASIFCLFMIGVNLPLKCLNYKPVALHPNLKILIFNAAFLCIISSISTLMLQISHQIKFLTYTNPCDLLIEYWKCLAIKEGGIVATVGFTLFHVILCLERSTAVLFPARYETSSVTIGVISTILMWLTILCWNIWMVINDNLNAELPYCNLTTTTNAYKWSTEFIALMALDIIVLTIDILITIVNKRLLKRHKINPTLTENFLGNVYQLNENARTMSIILPISIAHSAIVLLFLASTITVRNFFQYSDPVISKGLIECTNTIACTYTIVIPLVYFRLKKNLSPKITPIISNRNCETEMYFKMFDASINVEK